MAKARYIMIGGFLGAGKTTAILRLAELLTAQGLKVGLITNDQSVGLVDTTLLGAHGFPVEEITGGCFCCRFNSLVTAAERLSEETRPDVFLAEPVGSCTDLKATVDYPLRRLYGDNFAIAPFSVLIDPARALRILGLETGASFSPKVVYIYEKQLEEADVIVINKIDTLIPERLERLEQALTARFPKAQLVRTSAREGVGLEPWLERLSHEQAQTGTAMEVDYDRYADGEALLGWLNATLQLSADEPFDGNVLLTSLTQDIQARLQAAGVEIAHLKLTLTPLDYGTDLGVINAVRNDLLPELSHTLQEPLELGELILNLRAEAPPEQLKALVLAALPALPVEIEIEHLESFQPGRPEPTHRLTEAT
ncbi:GTP-binding protein [Armatimonas rosea]|uniref:G3E family GTPase n=1 Tax=Armatimonas rosea TaxID=685828 RepID=A0A7W9SL12_ARMRO|nr:GTP-binding protein [Armatimonas rosea]MBB6048545.1 G3E family GTPase [Armatimonas rosea]